MITIHGMIDSGNCYKPRLLAALLGIPFRHNEVSFLDGGTQSTAFRQRTPIGKVPLLELEDGRFLPESNAILAYLGADSRFVPSERFANARMLSWMFFEQYSHEPHVAVRRSLLLYPQMASSATPERLSDTLAGGRRALAVMEEHLADADWLVGTGPTLADIALYAYTHRAGEGGFDLEETPGIGRWLARVEALPGYVPMTWQPQE